MPASVQQREVTPSASTAAVISALLVEEYERDAPRIAIPSAEVHLVARFGAAARRGLDVHALGAHQTAHRKLIRGGQRSVAARLQLGAHLAVLGVPGAAIAGRHVALEDVWGDAAAERLCEQLAHARDTFDAATILEAAILERLTKTVAECEGMRLALDSCALLGSASVHSVANNLGVSERHLRRVFRENLGMSPKTFAKLARFQRAVDLACADARASWTTIAAMSGYYDQAHLIAECRTLTGTTPQVLLHELGVNRAGSHTLPSVVKLQA